MKGFSEIIIEKRKLKVVSKHVRIGIAIRPKNLIPQERNVWSNIDSSLQDFEIVVNFHDGLFLC